VRVGVPQSARCSLSLPIQTLAREGGRISEPASTLPALPAYVRNAQGLVRPSRRRAGARKDPRCERRPESPGAKPPIREPSCLPDPYPAHEALSPDSQSDGQRGSDAGRREGPRCWAPRRTRSYNYVRRLGNDLGAGARVHRLPSLQVDGHFASRLIVARSARHGHVERVIVRLFDDAFGRAQVALEVAQEGGITNSDSHRRKHGPLSTSMALPASANEVTRDAGRDAEEASPGRIGDRGAWFYASRVMLRCSATLGRSPRRSWPPAGHFIRSYDGLGERSAERAVAETPTGGGLQRLC